MVGIPLFFDLALDLGPDLRLGPVLVHKLGRDRTRSPQRNFIGPEELPVTAHPDTRFFWPAVQHNIIWLAFLMFIATPIGMFLAVLLDENSGARGSTRPCSSCRRPVARGHRLHLELHTRPTGPDQQRPRRQHATSHLHRLDRQPEPQPLGGPRRRLLAARRLHHGPLPGRPEERRPDPSRSRRRRRQRVADVQERHLPDPAPTNIVIVVVTIIEALRAFDLVYVFNGGDEAPSCCRSWSRTTSSASPAVSATDRRSPWSCW